MNLSNDDFSNDTNHPNDANYGNDNDDNVSNASYFGKFLDISRSRSSTDIEVGARGAHTPGISNTYAKCSICLICTN